MHIGLEKVELESLDCISLLGVKIEKFTNTVIVIDLFRKKKT